jgi:hypothetical protein
MQLMSYLIRAHPSLNAAPCTSPSAAGLALFEDVPRERGRRAWSGLAPQGRRGQVDGAPGHTTSSRLGGQLPVDVQAEATLTAQGRGGCQPAHLGESGLGGAEPASEDSEGRATARGA